ncbi:MAG TPA: phage holin family protein [Verrucomicrobia bacterium]|nr:phage holin family protein [Verrucomicrobiota bacterium]HOB31654.1 phage holin family protein [Verrucomicrobiota bacterium]HOP97517.1 phage holin family protein [Verrucomicrobiota bacterium]HPU55728.1 phage holin family protein [Verrucomicrobiota bacterium]
MPLRLKKFLQSWIINTLAVLVAVSILPGLRYDTVVDLFVASLLLGILNAFVRPFLIVLALPLLIFTLGLFYFVINGLLLYFVGFLVKGFHVDGFWWAFGGALIISVISLVLNFLTGTGDSRIEIRRGRSRRDSDDNGPVIDV